MCEASFVSGTSKPELRMFAGRELPAWAFQVAFSPNGSTLATSCGDGLVRLWSTITGSLITELAGHHGSVEPVAFSHDGRALAAGDEKGYLWVWDLQSRRKESSIKAHDAPVYSIAFSSNDQRLLTASRDFTAKLSWRAAVPQNRWR